MKQSLHSLWRKCFYLSVVALSSHLTSFCQSDETSNFEGGFTAGPMAFMGDLGGHSGKGTTFLKDYNMNETKMSFGAFVATYPQPWLGFRLALNFGALSGDDADIHYKAESASLEQARLARNLDFRTNIVEGFVAAEIYPTVFLEDEPDDVVGRLRPYGLIGLGVFHFNPQGLYHDATNNTSYWVDLKPLHTEGEGFAEYPNRKNYSLTQLNIPMGVGLKYYISENVNVSFEIVYRKTFTDYIDDVSTTFIDPNLFYKYLSPAQAKIADYMSNKSPYRTSTPGPYGPGGIRGDASQKDAYFTTGIKMAFKIGNHDRWRNSTHCPLLRF
ncbi:MAG: hypothetical protein P4L51_03565 [Puia sp.]|nr:hypothetical protein [Puia sp.]